MCITCLFSVILKTLLAKERQFLPGQPILTDRKDLCQEHPIRCKPPNPEPIFPIAPTCPQSPRTWEQGNGDQPTGTKPLELFILADPKLLTLPCLAFPMESPTTAPASLPSTSVCSLREPVLPPGPCLAWWDLLSGNERNKNFVS